VAVTKSKQACTWFVAFAKVIGIHLKKLGTGKMYLTFLMRTHQTIGGMNYE